MLFSLEGTKALQMFLLSPDPLEATGEPRAKRNLGTTLSILFALNKRP
jgi:hypothetical protein